FRRNAYSIPTRRSSDLLGKGGGDDEPKRYRSVSLRSPRPQGARRVPHALPHRSTHDDGHPRRWTVLSILVLSLVIVVAGNTSLKDRKSTRLNSSHVKTS